MTPDRLLKMHIEGLYLPKKIYTPEKQISGYAPDSQVHTWMQKAMAAWNLNVSASMHVVVWPAVSGFHALIKYNVN